MSIKPIHGHIYRMQDPEYGVLHCLVLADEPGFTRPDSCFAVRITVTREQLDFPGWIRLTSGDPAFGYIALTVDDMDRVDYDELAEDLGAISVETQLKVNQIIKRIFRL